MSILPIYQRLLSRGTHALPGLTTRAGTLVHTSALYSARALSLHVCAYDRVYDQAAAAPLVAERAWPSTWPHIWPSIAIACLWFWMRALRA